jgi:hypothetical protein
VIIDDSTPGQHTGQRRPVARMVRPALISIREITVPAHEVTVPANDIAIRARSAGSFDLAPLGTRDARVADLFTALR